MWDECTTLFEGLFTGFALIFCKVFWPRCRLLKVFFPCFRIPIDNRRTVINREEQWCQTHSNPWVSFGFQKVQKFSFFFFFNQVNSFTFCQLITMQQQIVAHILYLLIKLKYLLGMFCSDCCLETILMEHFDYKSFLYQTGVLLVLFNKIFEHVV